MKRLLLTSLVVLCALACGRTPVNNETPQEADTTVCDTVRDEKTVLKEQLVAEVDSYIKTKTSKSNKHLPNAIVDGCLNNNIDICFVIAQTEIETCFGTTGIGRERSRHSLFGIYKTYANYEKCIEDYFRVLKKYYLTKGRTEKDLMRNYVTSGGSRYAGNLKYESKLSNAYKEITQETKIHSLQIEYKKVT